MSDIVPRILMFAIAIPSIVFHEVAHGYVAYRLGDPTAKSRGRLSLNPVKHIDPFGTVLLPLLLLAGGLPPFGYAKPVPIQPAYFRDYRKGMLLTGLAGPATNLVLAVIAGLSARAVELFMSFAGLGAGSIMEWIWLGCFLIAYFNLVLMFFNLIPIPPLDGSRVLPVFLSDEALHHYHRFERYGIMVVFGALLLLPQLFHIDIVGAYLSITVDPLLYLLTGASFG
ncbi:MAG: site-2 protease family protein [Coriobacteriia bacterium]|nr:site-2 protease family protein [Coriobacteriia bacterium]